MSGLFKQTLLITKNHTNKMATTFDSTTTTTTASSNSASSGSNWCSLFVLVIFIILFYCADTKKIDALGCKSDTDQLAMWTNVSLWVWLGSYIISICSSFILCCCGTCGTIGLIVSFLALMIQLFLNFLIILFQFIWMIIGSVWLSNAADCVSSYSYIYGVLIAYIVWNFLSLCCAISVLCCLCCACLALDLAFLKGLTSKNDYEQV
eukprot:TRINITY_DN601_c2_g1_i1.p1 TRINITY_DN601_c2_g1~~TRINITY_DN601_c2_g1_i1.p1  ORF type:complete len:207 (+),score=21.89 TRINITY_DN601_c2_g1_i1:520-1140(+)